MLKWLTFISIASLGLAGSLALSSDATQPALLGDTAVELHRGSLVAGQAEAFSLQAGATGVASKVHVYIGSANAASTVIVGLYRNGNGGPRRLLSTGSAPASGARTWTVVSIAPIELTAGTTYWLAVLGEGGALHYRDGASGSCPSQTSALSTLGALPRTWRAGTVSSDCPISAYVTAAEPGGAAPVNTALPAISGAMVEGRTLTASAGTWTGSPTSYAYQWQDCKASGAKCSSIVGADTNAFVLGATNVGHTVRVVVTATNADGATPASSAATALVTALKDDVPLYAPTSLWNTPVSANPEISPEDAEEIKTLDGGNCKVDCGDTLNTGIYYSPTVWYATPSTPLVKVQINYPTCDAEEVAVPLEPGWAPDPSDEGHMAVLGYNKKDEPTEYDFWRGSAPDERGKGEDTEPACAKTGQWMADEVVAGENWQTGTGAAGLGVHASKTPEGAGLITQKDLESKASYWSHALAFSYGHNCKESLSWCGRPLPASGTGDGTCTEQAVCIPEGARVQLEPSFDCTVGNNEIRYKWEEQFCNTLRIYGMIDVDSCCNYSKDEGSGINVWDQQFVSWGKGFAPPWRTEYVRGAAAELSECEKVIFKFEEPVRPVSWCVGERVGIMPDAVMSHMRVLKW